VQAGPSSRASDLSDEPSTGELRQARGCSRGSGYTVVPIVAGGGFIIDPCIPFETMSQWNHVAFTATGGSADVYFNGEYRGSFTYQAPVPRINETTWIGNLANFQSANVTRMVDDVGVWTRVLAEGEIDGLYRLGPGSQP
jgi:Concanavalin A-like lectin/glucanases superfamily